MEYRKSIIIIILAIFLVSIASASAADANDTAMASRDTQLTDEIIQASENQEIEMQGSDNDGMALSEEDSSDDSGTEHNFHDIENAIRSDCTIYLEPGTYFVDNFIYLRYMSNIRIIGDSTILDAQGGTQIFNLDGVNNITMENIIFKNAYLGNKNDYGGAIEMTWCSCSFSNCTFINNHAGGRGGAIYGYDSSCLFKDCIFINNTSKRGGAIYMDSGNVINCDFIGNNASIGSAIYLASYAAVSNSTFLNNRADANFLDVTKNENNITITFKGMNNLINAIYAPGGAGFTNVTYWGANGITNTDDSYPPESDMEAGQNVTVRGFVNGNILNTVKTTDAEGKIVLEDVIGDYGITVSHESDSYYTGAETIFSTIYVNVTEIKTANKTVNITAKSNIPHEIIQGNLLFILPNGTEINATYADDGIWWAVHTFDGAGDYSINAFYTGLESVIINKATISIDKVNSTVDFNDTIIFGEDIEVTTEGTTGITAKIDGENVSVEGNTIKLYPPVLNAGTHTLTVTTIPDKDHNPVTKTVNITVNKADSGIVIDVKKVFKVGEDILITLIPINSTGGVTVKINGKYYAVNADDQVNISGGWAADDYIIEAFLAGDENYNESNATKAFKVAKNNIAVSLDATVLIYVGSPVAFTARLNETTTGKVIFTINGENYTVNITDSNNAVHYYTPINNDALSVVATFTDNDKYNSNSTSKDFKVNKVASSISLADVTIEADQTARINITVTDGATGLVNVTVNGIIRTVNLTDSKVTVNVTDLENGTYQITAKYLGDLKYVSCEDDSHKIYVNKATQYNITVTATDTSVGGRSVVEAILPSNANGTFAVGDKSVKVENGKANITLDVETRIGEKTVHWMYSGDSRYVAKESDVTYDVVKANSTVDVTDVVLYYGETKNVTVTAEGATGITAKVNENNVTVVNNYTIPISGLDAGNYTLAVTTIPDGNHNPVTKTVYIAVNKAATEIILANETLYLKAYDVVGDVAKLSPADAGNLTFTSSDEDIALVYDGTIWSRIKGNATVTVSFAGNDNYAASENKTITVYVSPKDASVSVENDTVDLNVDDTCIIDATANPRFLTVYYASSNQSIATVTDYGNVKAVGEGTAIITLTVGNGETYAVNSTNVTVTVSKIPTEINIDPASLDLFVGDETVIAANLTPANAGNVTFTSSDYDVVDFDDEGNVIAQGTGQAIITVSFAGDNKYATAENKTITVTVSLNDASVTVDNDTLDLNVGETYAINATKSPDTILLDIAYTSSDSSVATVNENGVVTAVGEGTAIITVEVGDGEIYAINSTNVTVTVSRIPTEIAADPITATYNANEYLVITLKDANGTPISGENITVDVNGVETYLTDENGSVKVSTNGLASGIYDARITFNGSAKYVKSAKAVNVTIKKATPVINATAKTFKTTDKTKKYQVSLKDDNGNPMANAIVTLKVNGKTYYAKTDENGQATFRLTKLTMAATYTAAITYRGDDNYKKVFQKVKLTVKTGFKTVSKGSKDKAIVKKIQVALKSNGYYIKSNGHKLKVDGIYDIYTEKAVKQFQKANGLKVTGKVDENTALKLGII